MKIDKSSIGTSYSSYIQFYVSRYLFKSIVCDNRLRRRRDMNGDTGTCRTVDSFLSKRSDFFFFSDVRRGNVRTFY